MVLIVVGICNPNSMYYKDLQSDLLLKLEYRYIKQYKSVLVTKLTFLVIRYLISI